MVETENTPIKDLGENDYCAKYFNHSFELFRQFMTLENFSKVKCIAKTMANSLRNGYKIICAGNGGSSQDAGHLVEELTGRFYKDRPSLPAIAINDTGHITCVANDYGYDFIFSRYLEAHGKHGDVFIGFTTSGNSKNIIEALETARKKQLDTVVLTGQSGGEIFDKRLARNIMVVPSDNSSNAQEIHIKIVHCLIYLIEKELGYETLNID